MTHLGDRQSALVDGQLSVEATERAHAHLARCRDCSDAVETERLLKTRLNCLPTPDPSAALFARLLALGGPAGPLPPRPGHVPGTPRPERVLVSAVPGGEAVSSGGAVPPRWISTERPAADGAAAHPALATPWANVRPHGAARSSTRPAGRPAGLRRARLAGAVLGALGVVGAGVGGLVMAAPSTPAGPAVPASAPLDSFVVHRPAHPPTGLSADVPLRFQPGSSPPRTLPSHDGR